MITGYLSRWETEKKYYPQVFDQAFSFLQQDIVNMEAGKYPILDTRIYAVVEHSMTEDCVIRRPEMHKRYVDIHVLLKGKEKILFCDTPPTVTPLEDKLEEDDVAFFMPDSVLESVTLFPGRFAVFFPEQVHTPRCAVKAAEGICKVVLKIQADLCW